MCGYIYDTTNLINGKKYIGKHKSKEFDKNYYGSGTSLKKALEKYGKENFSIKIIEEISNDKDYKYLSERERSWIEATNAVKSDKYYNNSYGGENEGWFGVNKMFKDCPEKWNKTVENSIKGRIGHKVSEETKLKISNKLKGRVSPMKGRVSPMKGKCHSEETKRKMSESRKGHIISEETRLKISNSLKRR